MKYIKKFTLGSVDTNAYLIVVENETWLIDAPENISKVISYCDDHKYSIDKVILTHTHYDHIAGLKELKNKYPELLIYVSPQEQELIKSNEQTLANYFNKDGAYHGETISLSNLDLDKYKVDIKYISGHSKEGAVIFFNQEKIIFSGDTLFRQSIGRSDLYYGNQDSLVKGIKEHIMILGDDFIVHPGHGFATKIGEERVSNPYL
jgi:glyoxylase-like metal-dependent hydrolase (beta-lactamase superfamily II)